MPGDKGKEVPSTVYMYWPKANKREAEDVALRCTSYLRKRNPILIAAVVKRRSGKWHVALLVGDVLKYPDVADIATGS